MAEGNGKPRVTLIQKVRKLRDCAKTARDELSQLGLESQNLQLKNQALQKKMQSPGDFFSLSASILPSSRWCCIVCNTPRLRPDITGLTCGSLHCLTSLGSIVDDLDSQTQLKVLSVERDEIRQSLLKIAELLGLDNLADHEKDDDLVVLCQEIFEEIEEIVEELD